MTRRVLITAISAALLAACGSSSKPAPAAPTGAAVFTNGGYVDFSPTHDPSSAASNVVAAIAANPATPTSEFTGTTQPEIKTALAGKRVVAFPWQAIYLNPDLDQKARDEVKAFVSGGGTALFFWLDTGSLAMVNATFGWSLAEGPTLTTLDTLSLNAAGAAGTAFAGGPATLESVDTTSAVPVANLPAGAKVIYDDGAGHAAVALLPVGAGRVILMGWDFTDAFPNGGQDGGWLDALKRATSY